MLTAGSEDFPGGLTQIGNGVRGAAAMDVPQDQERSLNLIQKATGSNYVGTCHSRFAHGA